MAEPQIVLPGHDLGPSSAYSVGNGTYIHGSNLHASIAGSVHSTHPAKSSRVSTISISRACGARLPEVGSIVLGRIIRTGPRQANISILALGSSGEHVFNEAFPGAIRQQDIRATEIDKVKVAESFRVGDVVRAVVISLGDERSYYLSTAKNELGVVMARSEAGNQMVPVSWREFMDQETGTRETRKVAKPV